MCSEDFDGQSGSDFWRGFGEGAGLNNPVTEPKRSQKPKRPLSIGSPTHRYSFYGNALKSRIFGHFQGFSSHQSQSERFLKESRSSCRVISWIAVHAKLNLLAIRDSDLFHANGWRLNGINQGPKSPGLDIFWWGARVHPPLRAAVDGPIFSPVSGGIRHHQIGICISEML